MGCAITPLIEGKTIKIEDLKGKILAVDGNNILYQFLTTIRQRDGTPLLDKDGNITSHLNGLFSRSTSLMESGLKLIFVFDGEPPELKSAEIERRRELKKESKIKYEEAIEKGSAEDMKKYSSRLHWLNPKMIEESKELLSALGIPVVQAPSEGEVQAAYMVSRGDAYAVVSQDADALLSGAERVVKNLSISGRRKKIGKLSYETVKPEIISLSENLNKLGITHDQLIVLSILVGTDFNIGGVKGLGPKKSLKLVKDLGTDYDSLFKSVDWNFPYPWKKVYDTIKNIPLKKDYKIEWKRINEDKVLEILCRRHQFSEDRVRGKLKKLIDEQKNISQSALNKWL